MAKDKGPPWWISSRFLLAYLSCWGYGNFFLQRVNLSMAVVCMVNHTAVDLLTLKEEHKDIQTFTKEPGHLITNETLITGKGLVASDPRGYFSNHSSRLEMLKVNGSQTGVRVDFGELSLSTDICSVEGLNETEREDGELVWPKDTQGLLLGGFYWGYMALQLPSQRTAQIIGAKYLALIMSLVLSTLTMLAPMVSLASPWALMSLRVIQGMTAALGVPAMYGMWRSWAPSKERSSLLSIVFTGAMLANAIVYPSSGLLCEHGFAGGWPSTFYVFGIVGFIWCFLWMFFVFETPESHPRIHPKEKEYILQARGNDNKSVGSVPWLKIFSSLPVWAVAAAQVAYNWPFFMLISMLPQYMKEVLKFDIQSNGLLLMMPYIALYFSTNLWALVCRYVSSRKLLSVINIRRLSTAVGDIIPAALFIVISYLDCTHAVLAVILMTTAIGISGTNLQGFLVNPYDIAPRYATAILSLTNSIAMATGIISPYVVGAMTVDKTREQWQKAFFLTSGITIACLIFFLIFGKGVEMEWAKEVRKDMKVEIPSLQEQTPGNELHELVEKKKDDLSNENSVHRESPSQRKNLLAENEERIGERV